VAPKKRSAEGAIHFDQLQKLVEARFQRWFTLASNSWGDAPG
jgi:hypothetical protein